MEMREESSGDATIVALTGRIDSVTSPRLTERLEALVAQGTRRLVIDLAGVDYISSAGLRAFMIGGRRAKQAGGGLELCRPSPSAQRVLDLARIGDLFPIHTDRPVLGQ
jgi:anti-anti-sigma factor